jgi:transposase
MRRRPLPIPHTCGCLACQSEAHPALRTRHQQMNLFLSRLTEPQRRWYAALESQRLGHGGDRYVARITGISEQTIRRGRRELDASLEACPVDRLRQPGGGRPAAEARDPALVSALEAVLAPETAGDPQGPAKYKRSSLRQLRDRLQAQGHPASPTTVGRLLKQLGYSPKANVRRKEAKAAPPERDAQFRHIEQHKQAFLEAGDPVISVDTKKGADR